MTYVGKVMRWSKPAYPSGRKTVNEYVILWEEGDRMLVYDSNRDFLRWMNHARKFVGKEYSSGHSMELVSP